MYKKLITLGIALALLITFVACGDDFTKYKANAKLEIQAYADSMGEDNYSAENWTQLQQAAANGKVAVDAAKDRDEVDNAFYRTKQKIYCVLNIEDEKIIGLGGFDGLAVDVELKIIKTYCRMYLGLYAGQESVDNSPIEEVYIANNGCIVVFFYRFSTWGWSSWCNEVFEDILFIYRNTELRVWKNDELYPFDMAYGEGFFTKADLEEIDVIQREYRPDYYDEV